MPEQTLRFPEGFLWGAATAAHQCEGDNRNNDWWAWEEQAGRIAQGHRSGRACAWWADAEADFDRMAALGLNALRLSVEWSRIEPRPGEFDPAALERYAQMLQGLRARGIEPMVTLHHFSNPLWLAERGGWENPETIDLFVHFAGRVVDVLGPLCHLWCTINEPNVYGYAGYMQGIFPPGKRDFSAAMRVIRTMLSAHGAAYREIHRRQPQARVGLALNMRILDPASPRSPLDRFAAGLAHRTFNGAVVAALERDRWLWPLGRGPARGVAGTLDWLGLNYYTRDTVVFDRRRAGSLFVRQTHAADAEMLDGGYGEFYPPGMYRFLVELAGLGLPLYVTENGIPDEDDDQRPRYIVAHLQQVWRAIQAGCPVRGYYHWTLVDNFEWAEGWTLRFGLIALDPATQVRTPRPSAELYAAIARANGIGADMVERYALERDGGQVRDSRVEVRGSNPRR